MRKKRLLELIVRAVTSLYYGAKRKVREESELSKEFIVEFGVHQESVFLPRRLKLQGK